MMAGGWYGFNVIEDQRAGQQAAEILSHWEDEPRIPQGDEGAAPVIVVDGDAFCGQIVIDKLGIELPVYNQWSNKRLKSAPCRYSGNVVTDDMIIAAHNYKSHFGPLSKLRRGDGVAFVDAYGTVHRYVVRDMTTLDGTAVSDMHAGGWDLTLFTCTKSGEQRVTVRCERA